MQFMLGPRFPVGLRDWQQIRIGEKLHLAAHPDLDIEQVSNGSESLTLIGYLLDPHEPLASNGDILGRLITSMEQGEDLFALVYPLGGRWVLIAKNKQSKRLFGDATGLRQVFYCDRAHTDECWCASQPSNIASALGIEMELDAADFFKWFQTQRPGRSWWPGDSSPYSEIRRLLPNHYLDLETGNIQRFWPLEPLAACVTEEAVADIALALTGMMSAAAARFDLAIGISAGWDSRLILAASRSLAGDLHFFTSQSPDRDLVHMDIRIPKRLLNKLGLTHDIIKLESEVSPDFAVAYKSSVPFAHSDNIVALQTQFNYYKRRKVGVTGNVSEVARCYYGCSNAPDQVTAEHLMKISEIGHPFARAYFQAWLDDAGNTCGYNILDLFYWEQRIGSWFAQNCLGMDLAWRDVFIPFNSRQLLVKMLEVPESYRKSPDFELYRHIMEELWPQVLSEPINPESFANRLQNVLHKYSRATVRRLRKLLEY